MTAFKSRASPLAAAVAVVIAVVSVVAFFVTRQSARSQDQALLDNDTNQAALLTSTIFSGLGSGLDTLATAVTLTNGSPAAFDSAAARSGSPLTVLLAKRTGSGYQVVAVVGSGFTVGQLLGGQVGDTLSAATANLLPTPVVRSGNASTAGFAIGPPLVPAGFAIYEQFSLDPFTATPVTDGKPFASIRVALYGSKHPAPGNLLVATTRNVDFTGTVARTSVPVGAGTWTLVAEPRSDLAGSFSRQAPYVILLLGLLFAIVLGATVELLVRRERYAAALVAERTSDLEVSLSELRLTQDALVRGERLAAVGEMASVVGHELRNPLTAVTNALYLVRADADKQAADEMDRHLAMAERETAKAAAMAEDLTAFVRPREPSMAPVDLRDVVDEVVEVTPPPAQVDLAVDVTSHTVVADRGQLAEVLTNLLSNAYQAVPDGGSVRISVNGNGMGTVLAVEDSGPGVDERVQARVFEPFFTTKSSGTGLGLAIVRRLVEANGGEVSFESNVPHGTRVTVRLPEQGPVR